MISGNLPAFAVIGLVAGTGLVVVCLLRPRWLLMALLFGILMFEHYAMAFPSVTLMPQLYDNFNVTLGIEALKFNPIEVILALIAFGWGLFALTRRSDSLYIQTVSILGAAWGAWVLFSVCWGIVNGGNWKVGLWILRPVVYFLGVSFLSFHLMRSPRHVRDMAIVLAVGILLKSFQIIYRKLLGGIEGTPEAYGGHEDTGFALWMVWMALAAFFLPLPKRASWSLWIVLPVILLAVVFNDRRINVATMVVGTGLLVLMISARALKSRADWLTAGALAAGLYLVAGWFGPDIGPFKPVKGFKEGIRAELMGENTDASSWYRKVERYNLRHTIRANPILGTGLGVPYLQMIHLDKLTFGYAVYISHNQVLLVHSAMGSVGYFIFLTFFTTLMAQLAIYSKVLKEPWHRAVAICALLSVMNWIVVGYYNMQLFFFRNSIVMGVIIAMPAVLYRWQMEQTAAQSTVEATDGEAPAGA